MATDIQPENSTEPSELTPEDKIAQDILVETEQTSRIPKPAGVDSNSRVLWEYLIPVIAFHLLIPLAFATYFFSWWGRALVVCRQLPVHIPRIGAGYHRLLTHRGFKCPKWFEYMLATAGVCSFQDSPARWVLVHRRSSPALRSPKRIRIHLKRHRVLVAHGVAIHRQPST